MADPAMTDEQMAMLLQASRQFAFDQMAAAGRLLPFAARVKTDGEVEFVSFAAADGDQPLDEIYATTAQAMATQAKDGDIVAAALVAAVEIQGAENGFDQALRIHLEAADFVRQVLAPYAIVSEGEGADSASLKLGELIPLAAEAEIFTA